jgi:hypothetical protein
MGLFHAEHVMKNSRASPLCNAEVPAENFAWYGLSFNTEEMVSDKSLVRGFPHRGSSHSEVLSSTKRLRPFYTVERANTYVS